MLLIHEMLSFVCCDYQSIMIHIGAESVPQAHFGQGDGPVLLDNVQCNPRESTLSLLQCRHRGVYIHNCDHTKDAGVRCEVEQVSMNVSVTASDSTTAVVVTWELQDNDPRLFEVGCFNENHIITLWASNKTFATQIAGLNPFSNYTCCVAAVFGSQASTTVIKSCSYIEIFAKMSSPKDNVDTTSPATTTADSEATSLPSLAVSSPCNCEAYSANVVTSGVLGVVIFVLSILLALTGTALVYLLRSRRSTELEKPSTYRYIICSCNFAM